MIGIGLELEKGGIGTIKTNLKKGEKKIIKKKKNSSRSSGAPKSQDYLSLSGHEPFKSYDSSYAI
jgi:hypothetical protein